MGLTVSKWIIKRHPNGFISLTIEGERGQGKSSYALKVMKDVYQSLYGLGDWEAWNKALDMTLFDLKDVINLIYNAVHDDNIDVIPAFCWDDAGVHACSYRYFTDLREVILLHGLLDTIRSAVTGFLLTTPSRQILLSFLRNYEDYIVKIGIESGDRWSRVARGYKKYTLPSGTKRIYKKFEDYYSCYIPNDHSPGKIPKDIYDQYMLKRNKYLKTVTDDMKTMMEKMRLPESSP